MNSIKCIIILFLLIYYHINFVFNMQQISFNFLMFLHVLSLFCFALFLFFFLRVCVCVWLVEKRNSGSSNNRGLCYGLCRSGPVGMAAAAAIVSSKKRKRPHSFETNPSIRKRQHNRLLRKLKVRF